MPRGVYVKKLGVHGKHKRTPETLAKQSESMREASKAFSDDPEWRRRVSEGTRERMHDPEVRERHLAGLERARQESPMGSSWRGGQGCEPNSLEKSYDWLLIAGYVSNFPVHVTLSSQLAPSLWYRLDYALPEAKMGFEIDGPTHKKKQEKDAVKSYVLEALGWKIIRIRHW